MSFHSTQSHILILQDPSKRTLHIEFQSHKQLRLLTTREIVSQLHSLKQAQVLAQDSGSLVAYHHPIPGNVYRKNKTKKDKYKCSANHLWLQLPFSTSHRNVYWLFFQCLPLLLTSNWSQVWTQLAACNKFCYTPTVLPQHCMREFYIKLQTHNSVKSSGPSNMVRGLTWKWRRHCSGFHSTQQWLEQSRGLRCAGQYHDCRCIPWKCRWENNISMMMMMVVVMMMMMVVVMMMMMVVMMMIVSIEDNYISNNNKNHQNNPDNVMWSVDCLTGAHTLTQQHNNYERWASPIEGVQIYWENRTLFSFSIR